MFGVGSKRVPAGSRPLTPLAGGYRDGGILLIGLGVADALALNVFLNVGSYYWVGVIVAVLLFTVAYVVLDDHNQKWLTIAVESAEAIPENAVVRNHPRLALSAAFMVLGFGAGTAAWVLLLGNSGFMPGMMIGQGLTMLVRAERVRSWQRDHNSELLESLGWRRQHRRGYFIRSLALTY